MKLVWVVLGLGAVLTAVGVGVACGPEEKYCYKQHEACSAAVADEIARITGNVPGSDGGSVGDQSIVIEAL
jgi:hypothetical protein